MKVKRPAVATNISRRIVVSGILGGGLTLVMGKQVRAACVLTAGQAEGPFYPTEFQETDVDMTTVSGGTARAGGEVRTHGCGHHLSLRVGNRGTDRFNKAPTDTRIGQRDS